MTSDQQDQRGPVGVTSTAEATHQLHEGTRAMATGYSTSIPPVSKSLTKQEIAAQLLPLLKAFREAHKDEPGFDPGRVVDRALHTVVFNVEYDLEYGE